VGSIYPTVTPGDYTTLLLDRPSTSPCNDRIVTDILVQSAGADDPVFLLPYLGQRVVVKCRVICPASGIQFVPADIVFPVY
jgi:hypothetical protein